MALSVIISAISGIPYNVRQVLMPTLMIIMVLVSLATIVVVLMQKSAENNLGALSGNDSTDTYMSKNKGKTLESRLKKATIALGAVLLVLSIAYFLIAVIG